MKILEDEELYRIMQWDYSGMPITVRFWKFTEITEIKVDNYFAKANGFHSVADMAARTVGQNKFDELFGGVPEWIRVDDNGNFVFVGLDARKFN